MRIGDIVMTALAFGLLLWLLIPSSVFLRVDSLVYDEEAGRVVFVREPRSLFGPIRAQWETEITTLRGRECHERGVSLYQNVKGAAGRPENTVTYPISDALWRCLRDGQRPLVARTTWWVKVFGVISLRPTSFVTDID